MPRGTVGKGQLAPRICRGPRITRDGEFEEFASLNALLAIPDGYCQIKRIELVAHRRERTRVATHAINGTERASDESFA